MLVLYSVCFLYKTGVQVIKKLFVLIIEIGLSANQILSNLNL
jgi:hypothetical protein